MRLKICRKEAKESGFWLKLIKETNSNAFHDEVNELMDEADQLRRIFSTIIQKSKS